jgi:hypothetical protein
MATRSTIAVQHEDGTVSQIYCHFDGYPSHNGRILHENYTTLAKVEELISHSDMSILAKNINPTGEHTFDNPEDDVCVYYGRDRGEDDTEARTFENERHYRLATEWEEYNYLFKVDTWYLVPTNYHAEELEPLILTLTEA